jgi:uncharacterized membrane protein
MLGTTRRAAFPVIVVVLLSTAALAQFENFDPPDAANTEATSINDSGEVAGWYWDTSGGIHSFRRSPDGALETFSAPLPNSQIQATGINSSGTIIGWVTDQHAVAHSFLRPASGLPLPFDVPGSSRSAAFTINSNGVIAGICYLLGNINEQSYVRDAGGHITVFRIPGTFRTLAVQINNAGFIAGYDQVELGLSSAFHGFLRNPHAGGILIFDVPRSVSTKVSGMNNGGTIAGDFFDQHGSTHHYIRTVDGKFTLFDTPGGSPIGFPSNVTGINDGGTVVGYYQDPHTLVYYGFVRAKNGVITRFGDPAEARGTNSGTFPSAINNNGAITGAYSDKTLAQHGFVVPQF